MGYPSSKIERLLSMHRSSGQSVASFCEAHSLNVSTFYTWRNRYTKEARRIDTQGFREVSIAEEASLVRRVCLPSGLGLDIEGLSITEIAALIVEIDRSYA